jgi:hypothetical protein
MEKRINIAELLRDCPTGMELDCTMFENVTFVRVDMNKRQFPIEIAISGIRSKYLTKEGCFHDITLLPESKCVIFPKGKTTWEGFQRPFKDGDVLHIVTGEGDYSLCIVDCIIGNVLYTKASCSYNGHFLCTCEEQVNMDELVVARLATDEGKQILFDAINKDGYKWNAETKTLEKLVNMEDKEINNFNVLPGLYKCVHRMFDGTPDGKLLFEVGNIYKCLSKHDRAEFEVSYGHSIYLEDPVVCKHFIPFGKQGEQTSNPCEKCNHPMLNCHNFPCGKKKTFDQGKSALEAIREERVDNANKIEPKFKVGDRIIQKNGITKPFTISQVGGGYYYVNDKNAVGIMRIEDQDKYELVPNKFDVHTLKPFESRVLVRDSNMERWMPEFFGCLCDSNGCPYMIIGGTRWKCCIPYEGNKHLLNKTDDCIDFYKTWE